MRRLKRLGYASAAIMLGVGLLHLVVGFRSVGLLGVSLPQSVVSHPVLDSQDRFYGAMLGGLGAILIYSLADVARYRGVIVLVAGTLFVGGLARLLSVLATGSPTPLVILFIAFELIVPAVLMRQLTRAAPP